MVLLALGLGWASMANNCLCWMPLAAGTHLKTLLEFKACSLSELHFFFFHHVHGLLLLQT